MKQDAYHPPLCAPPDSDLFGVRGRLIRERALRAGLLDSHWQKWEAEVADLGWIVQLFAEEA